MENPKCPYCGGKMIVQRYGLTSLRNTGWDDARYSYQCVDCEAESPLADTEEALAAAMKRDRAKGEWISKGESPFCGSEGRMYFNHEYECNHCGFTVRGGEPKYCPNCGADMRNEENDE